MTLPPGKYRFICFPHTALQTPFAFSSANFSYPPFTISYPSAGRIDRFVLYPGTKKKRRKIKRQNLIFIRRLRSSGEAKNENNFSIQRELRNFERRVYKKIIQFHLSSGDRGEYMMEKKRNNITFSLLKVEPSSAGIKVY